jgi:hypothetical protein
MTTQKDFDAFSASLPEAISLNGILWKLQTKNQEGTDPDCFGDTEAIQRVISVYGKPHRKYTHRGTPHATLFHELMHASLASTGIAGLLQAGVEEALVTALEEGLFPHIAAGLFSSTVSSARPKQKKSPSKKTARKPASSKKVRKKG